MCVSPYPQASTELDARGLNLVYLEVFLEKSNLDFLRYRKNPGRPLIQKSIPNVRPTVLKKDPYQGLIFYETKPHIKDFSLAKTKFHGRIVNWNSMNSWKIHTIIKNHYNYYFTLLIFIRYSSIKSDKI